MFRNGILVESLSPSDCPEYMAVSRKTYEETYPKLTKAQLDTIFGTEAMGPLRPAEYGSLMCQYLVAKHQGRIIGYAQVKLEEHGYASLEKLFVLGDFQQQGCGNWLLQACYRYALEKERTKMHLKVFVQNPEPLSFFVRQGFDPIGEPSREEKTTGNFDYQLTCENIRAKLRAQPVTAATPSWWDRFDFKMGSLLSLATWFVSSRVTPSVPLQGVAVLLALGIYACKLAFVDGAANDATNARATDDGAGDKLLPAPGRR